MNMITHTTSKMKKIVSIATVILFIASCSAPDNPDERLAELRKQRDEYVSKIKAIDQEISELNNSGDINEGGPSVINVVVKEMEPSFFSHFIEVQGTVESDNNIFVPAESPGVVRKIYVDEGDYVEKGDLLAQIDATILLSQIEEIELNLELTTTVYNRQKRLWDQNIGSEIQYLQAKNNKENLERRLATVREQYEKTQIKAPISGIIDEIAIKEGEAAAAGFGAIRVVQISDLNITADISEKYIHSVKKGNTAHILIPGQDLSFEKKIDAVSQVINPDTRTFSVEISIPSEMKQIKPNMLAVVRINDYTHENALVVPVNVIQNDGSSDFLFVAEKNSDNWIARKKTVKTGKYYNNDVEIMDNLSAGEKVIISGYQNLASGQSINIVE